jgi:hypothetical protein
VAIVQAAERFQHDPTKPLEIDVIADDLRGYYDEAVKSRGLLEEPSDADWVDAFGAAVDGLKKAVAARDLAALSNVVEVLKALPNQQAALNSDLVRCARRLKPMELVPLMDQILAGLTSGGGNAPRFVAEFRDRLDRFRSLCDRLSGLILDHDACQRVETSLEQGETIADVTPERVPAWETVKVDLQALAGRRPPESPAIRLAQVADTFQATAAANPADLVSIARWFTMLLQRFRSFFLDVDGELLRVTDDLVKEAAYLDVQLRTATDVG